MRQDARSVRQKWQGSAGVFWAHLKTNIEGYAPLETQTTTPSRQHKGDNDMFIEFLLNKTLDVLEPFAQNTDTSKYENQLIEREKLAELKRQNELLEKLIKQNKDK